MKGLRVDRQLLEINRTLTTRAKPRDENVSHIASGYIYNSPSNAKVRADLAATAELGSSLFDYTNVTDAGVANTLWTLGPAVTSRPQIFRGYVQPGFPLLMPDLLVTNGAVFAGARTDLYVNNVSAVSRPRSFSSRGFSWPGNVPLASSWPHKLERN